MIACLGGASRVARFNASARILLPESGDERVREAAKYVTLEGLANVELIPEVRTKNPANQQFARWLNNVFVTGNKFAKSPAKQFEI